MMMKFTKVKFWNEDSIGLIAIDNGPDNLLDVNLVSELMAALTIASQDDNVRYVALTATGPLFFVGGVGWESINPDYASVREFVEALKALESLLLTIDKPVVVVLNGSVLSLGIDLMALGDLVIAPPDVKICHPEGALGIPLPLASWVLQGTLPRLSLLRLLSGTPMDSAELAKYGIVHVVPRQNLFGDAKSIILSIPEGVTVRPILRLQYRDMLDHAEIMLLNSLAPRLTSSVDRDHLISTGKRARLSCMPKP